MRFDLQQACEILERTPRALTELLGGLSEEWTTCNEGKATFSAWDVMGHLLDGEETDWIPRAEIILEHGPDRPFDPFDRFAFREKYRDLSLAELLRRFTDTRSENLRRLEAMNLSEEDLQRGGTHPELGPVTLGQLLATWVTHDLSHVRQVARVLAKQYKGEVGPWVAYIGALQE